MASALRKEFSQVLPVISRIYFEKIIITTRFKGKQKGIYNHKIVYPYNFQIYLFTFGNLRDRKVINNRIISCRYVRIAVMTRSKNQECDK